MATNVAKVVTPAKVSRLKKIEQFESYKSLFCSSCVEHVLADVQQSLASVSITFITGQYFAIILNDYKAVTKETVQDITNGSVKAAVYLTSLVASGILIKSNPSARDLEDALIESAHEISLIGTAIRSREADSFVDSLRSAQRDGLLHHTNLGLFSLVWLSDNRDELDIYKAQCSHVHLPWYQWHKRIVDVGILGKFQTLSHKMQDYDINEDAWNNKNTST